MLARSKSGGGGGRFCYRPHQEFGPFFHVVHLWGWGLALNGKCEGGSGSPMQIIPPFSSLCRTCSIYFPDCARQVPPRSFERDLSFSIKFFRRKGKTTHPTRPDPHSLGLHHGAIEREVSRGGVLFRFSPLHFSLYAWRSL